MPCNSPYSDHELSNSYGKELELKKPLIMLRPNFVQF